MTSSGRAKSRPARYAHAWVARYSATLDRGLPPRRTSGRVARLAHEVDDVVLDRGAHLDRPDRVAHREQLARAGATSGHAVERLGAGPVAPRDPRLVVAVRIAEPDPDEEPVELRLGQRERALELDRVLGREHEERVGQGARLALDRDLALLHRLQQRRLRARRRAVDLVHEQDVGEDRAGDEPEGRALEDARPEDVAGQQVGRALDAREAHAERAAERPREQGLADAGDVLDQRMAVGQDRDREQADDRLVDDDRRPDRVAHRPPEALASERMDRAAGVLIHGSGSSTEVPRSGRDRVGRIVPQGPGTAGFAAAGGDPVTGRGTPGDVSREASAATRRRVSGRRARP